ncbi:hypothetical protein AVEN_264116-1 [Araneus ventricosus]|uniref:Uncharacterized protein n=1 Tax=Araneus ventricosus TaxID=182803 RepID=A0A4Y2MMT7_ARAVE|nr:hypothetical protein AVEN_264116-1 [Araneus ventricosus]
MAEGRPSHEIHMDSDAEKMERFNMYQVAMRDHIGSLNVLRRRYEKQPTADLWAIMKDTAMELKRITVNDVLRLHGFSPSDEGTDSESNCSESSDKNIGMTINADINKCNSNDFNSCDRSSNALDGVNFNVVLDKVNDNVPNQDIIADDADSQFMNVDPTDSYNSNVNKETMDSDNFTTQGRRRKRAPSNKIESSKKIATDSGLPLKNSYEVLANLPAEGNPSNQTDKVKTATTPKIVPIMMRRSNDYRDLIKQINEVENIPCRAKEAGEFIKLFCDTPNHVRALTDFLDKKEKEYFVIPGRTERPI